LQLCLKPLHDALFNLLKDVETDGTFDQEKPLNRLIGIATDHRLRGFPDHNFSCFDLSAATDRLPIDLQVDILKLLIGESALN